uniref:Serine/threonine-protein phosphatase with EF-hands n=1 Tax=Monopterus albus TaxID=43700 RepID=A0A3Q3IKA4_MONAL
MGCGNITILLQYLWSVHCVPAIKAAILIQRWYHQYVARAEMRRRYTWHIIQSIEYSGEQAQIKLYNFLGYLMDNFTPSRNLISHIFKENEVCRDVEWERYFCYKNIEVPEIYSGPHLTFPLTVEQAVGLVEAFRNKKQLHSRYILQLLLETWKLLQMLPNINRVSTCQSKEITICGEMTFNPALCCCLQNGMPSLEKPYVFNRLCRPSDVYLNRGNHEDHIVNLRYGFTKEVLNKYKMHGKRILKLLQKIFILHGGISDATDLSILARVDRHRVRNHVTVINKYSYSHFYQLLSKSFKCLLSSVSPSSSSVGPPSRTPNLWEPTTASRTTHCRTFLHNTLGLQFIDMRICIQILDLLWSDPMSQEGCIPNEVRGGGCYWGPNVTEDFLNRHNLQLIIRSHECKQEGYEFCHNRKVLTLFSASNYYNVGSNRGAYLKLGPDLVPYVIQYQASSMTRELTVRQRTKRSALKVLREQLFVHKSDLIGAFKEFDSENTGLVSLNDWATAVESVMDLDLPWKMLRFQLVTCKTSDGRVDYYNWFNELAIKGPNTDVRTHLLETLYRHRSTVETIFRIPASLITIEDFRQTWKLLSIYLKLEITDKAISDLAITIDGNQDSSIDIDEFMEAFRLTYKKSQLDQGRSMFMGTGSDLTKLEGGPNT